MKNNFLYKLFHWEYWPSYMLYYPNIPFALYHAFKRKSFAFFTAVNPSIENSGIGTESKFATMQLIPKEYLPKTIFHGKNDTIKESIYQIKKQQLHFPLIVKPDIGFRGLLVEKINSKKELINYLKKYPTAILIQEFLSEKNECGIFYYRYPANKKGKITSLTFKDFPNVIGNGILNIEELVSKDRRAKLYLDYIKKNPEIDFKYIPIKNEKIILSSIGNHSKGTKFINANKLITPELETVFNEFNQKVKGWFYGRLDIKFNSFKDLEQGNFKVIELNGILAEPIHIYDATKISYFKALKEMRKHWKILYKIAKYNHDQKSIEYTKTSVLIGDMKRVRRYSKQLQKIAKTNFKLISFLAWLGYIQNLEMVMQ